MACPHCDQGALYRVKFPIIGIDSFMCDECNIVWLRLEDVSSEFGTSLHVLFAWMGAKDERAAIELKERVEWPNEQITKR